MPRTFIAVLAILVSLAADARGGDPTQEVKQAITALHAAFKRGDAAAVRALMTDDHVALLAYAEGPQSLKEQLASLEDQKWSKYKTGEMRMTRLGADAVLVTCPLEKGGFLGGPVPVQYVAASVWVRQGGRWLEAFYQETPLAEK